jgi:hypothetical protein
MGDLADISTRKVAILGNQHLSRAIIGGLSGKRDIALTTITANDQTPYFPANALEDAITHRTTNFSQQSLEQIFRCQDLVISTISPGDVELQKRIIDACIAADVKSFIPNEFGLDSRNLIIQELLPSYRARSEVIEYLGPMQSRLQWVAIAVGTILDHELMSGKIGFDLKWHSASIPGCKTSRFPATSLARVGQLVAKVVESWSTVQNRYLYAAGCGPSVDEVLKLLEKETGADWVVDCSDPQDIIRSVEEMLKLGWPDAGWTLMERVVCFDPSLDSFQPFADETANSMLGLGVERIEDIVRDAVHQWKHTVQGDCGCS